ncbi:hypothetical protein [Streptosporangium sandarakinum]|uniref:hypothetical protein n=1 Tax=Streptosporangium sandarakinum TaxID=1260955 RepID=UPI003722F15E
MTAHRTSTGEHRLAWLLTEVCAPQYVAIVLPVVVGWLSGGPVAAAWGLLASLVCAGIPSAVIAIGVRRGQLDSVHLVRRTSRVGPMLAGLAGVVAGMVLLIVLDAPRLVTATAAVMLGWVVALGGITLAWKVSFHSGVSAGAVVVMAHVLPVTPTLAIGAIVVMLISWARIRISHHTPAQTIVGALTAAIVTWGVLVVTA